MTLTLQQVCVLHVSSVAVDLCSISSRGVLGLVDPTASAL